LLIRAAGLCVWRFGSLADLFVRVLRQGKERRALRARALLHTLLGACYALRLKGKGVEHIHVHHGYFSSWIAMVAARLLGIPFSMTLHGSDLLLHGVYLDLKLKNCAFCVTVSEFNRRFALGNYPKIEPGKIVVQRIGVNPPDNVISPVSMALAPKPLMMLAVGRLHPVKDHAFLLRACHQLRARGTDFLCLVAGEGPERSWLEQSDSKSPARSAGEAAGLSWPAAARCLVHDMRPRGSHQPQRRHSPGSDGSDGPRQDRACP
jgi:glycosyltransferase involved in cell wall biosynthesis